MRCLGHIGTSVGSKDISIDGGIVDAAELVDKVRTVTGKNDPGFSRYNTLVMVDEGEAFVPAGRSLKIQDGAHVVLIPFSHGG